MHTRTHDLAVDQGHVETVSVLCAAGANVNQGDAVGRTPLFLAIDDGNLEIIQLLLSYGASRSITIMGTKESRSEHAPTETR